MSSSVYPVIWAMKHAPTADIYEQMVLIIMADSADEDGCNAYRSKRRIAELAKDIDERTVVRKWRSLEARGLIRHDTTPPPPRYLKIPKNRRPTRWELCIPYSWWSEAQREDIQRGREDRALDPLTPETRPDITAEPPAKKARSDKGKPNPRRSKKAAVDRGVSETPQESGIWDVSQSSPGVSESHPQGCLSDTQPSPLDLPGVPSSPPAPPLPSGVDVFGGTEGGREDDHEQEHEEQGGPAAALAADPLEDPEVLQERALALMDAAVRLWPKRHKAPGARDRLRLSGRIADELLRGGVEEVMLHELTRDLQDAGSALSVIMGSRTTVAGWGRPTDPRPDHSRYEIPRSAPWCGLCAERTRMVVVRDMETGEERPGRCRRPVVDSSGAVVACNPNTTPVSVVLDGEQDQAEDQEEDDSAALAQQMRDSLAEAAANSKGRADFTAVKKALETVGAAAAREEAQRLARRK